MGITGLQKYILASTNISQRCDYGEEIAKWRMEHGCNPTILIDLKEFSNVQSRVFFMTVNMGGVFDKYIEMTTYFFDQLKKCNVNLVFFLKEKVFEDNDEARKKLIKETVSPTDKLQRNNRRIFYDMNMLSRKYGELIITTKAYNNVIVNYANDHADKVLAIIGNDTDFLVFNTKFQYWPMADFANQQCFPGLNGLRFDRNTLMAETGMSNEQLRLLATLSDILENWLKFPRTHLRIPMPERFKLAIEYVKEKHLMRKNSFDWETIAGDVYGGNFTPEQLEDFKIRYDKFDTKYRPPTDQENGFRKEVSTSLNEVIDFCKKNNVYIYYELIGCEKRIIWLKDLCCLDIQNSKSIEFIDAVFTVFAKLPGVFFKDEDFNTRPKTIQVHNPLLSEDGGGAETRDIVYPLDSRTSLKQLITQQNNKAHDNERWELLKWVFGMDKGFLDSVRKIPYNNKQRVMTIALHFLLERNLIPEKSAKYILENELIARKRNAYTPKHLCPAPTKRLRRPRNVSPEWVQEAHKYGIAYWLVCQALEVCGLQNEMDLIQFNAFSFYESMVKPRQNWRKSPIEDILFPAAV